MKIEKYNKTHEERIPLIEITATPLSFLTENNKEQKRRKKYSCSTIKIRKDWNLPRKHFINPTAEF